MYCPRPDRSRHSRADVIACACPLCQAPLDMRQKNIRWQRWIIVQWQALVLGVVAHQNATIVAGSQATVRAIAATGHTQQVVGTVRVDREALAELEQACDWDPYQHELTHRTEHSIELQAVMLAHLFGEDVKIVPILCSDFEFEDSQESSPSIDKFLSACRRQIERADKKVSVIASADLAHVGKRFGDPFDIDDAVVEGVRGRDEEDLVFVHEIDATGFYRSVMKDDNERKVCGLNCIYSALRSIARPASKKNGV